jgi:16S rRNA (guanine(966)-N(2))-methyltransferase RsmD
MVRTEDAMRITAGSLRGRRLAAGRGKAIRPTSSRVREAIFNLLQDRIDGARVLDLFAGAGALGIEALSRGAISVLFVDSSRTAKKTIEENLKQLEIGEHGQVFCSEVKKTIGALSQSGERFQVIFIDPPYGKGMAEDSLQAIAQGSILSQDGIVLVEHDKREQIDDEYGILRLKTSKRYGDTRVSVFVTVPKGGSE